MVQRMLRTVVGRCSRVMVSLHATPRLALMTVESLFDLIFILRFLVCNPVLEHSFHKLFNFSFQIWHRTFNLRRPHLISTFSVISFLIILLFSFVFSGIGLCLSVLVDNFLSQVTVGCTHLPFFAVLFLVQLVNISLEGLSFIFHTFIVISLSFLLFLDIDYSRFQSSYLIVSSLRL